MAAVTPIRPEPAAHFKTFVKRAIVTALRSVFTDAYPNTEFRNLPVLLEYPQAKIKYPLMIVKFNDGDIMNAGVGHEEWAFDINGQYRKYFHYRFEGSLEFHLYTLSSLSQDLLSDSLIDVIAFGKLQSLTNEFYNTVFDEYANGGQLMLRTDLIQSLGVSVGKPFWNPEDTVLYEGGYTIACHGGFFSTGDDPVHAFFDTIHILPYIEGEERPAGEIDVFWPGEADTDMATVRLHAVVDGDEDYTPGP